VRYATLLDLSQRQCWCQPYKGDRFLWQGFRPRHSDKRRGNWDRLQSIYGWLVRIIVSRHDRFVEGPQASEFSKHKRLEECFLLLWSQQLFLTLLILLHAIETDKETDKEQVKQRARTLGFFESSDGTPNSSSMEAAVRQKRDQDQSVDAVCETVSSMQRVFTLELSGCG
jgi:hypothetical protein